MTARLQRLASDKWRLGVFALIQVAVLLLAISNESLWIDEFWTAHFGAMASFTAFYELLLVPSGSQTPLHFLHFYLWGLLNPAGEFLFRLANLPLFVAGQLAVFWALRDYPRKFAVLFLALSALHPMVWQYANEARPYIMMYAGAQMILAYLLNLHARSAKGQPAAPLFLMLFVLGGILLFGASLLGIFWVFSACVHVLVHHLRKSSWRELLHGVNPLLLGLFLAVVALLTVYYLNSLLMGAGASRLASSTPSTVLFAAYEVLGLAGIGPSRLELRSLGPAALAPYAIGLIATGGALLIVLAVGLNEARARLGTRELLLLGTLGLLRHLERLCHALAGAGSAPDRCTATAQPGVGTGPGHAFGGRWASGPAREVVARRYGAAVPALLLVLIALCAAAPQRRLPGCGGLGARGLGARSACLVGCRCDRRPLLRATRRIRRPG
jgi:hypothetical protein